jgi:hypothetical protein
VLRGQVVVGGLVRVGVVDPGRVDCDALQITRRLRCGQVDELEHLGPSEPADLDRSHRTTLMPVMYGMLSA